MFTVFLLVVLVPLVLPLGTVAAQSSGYSITKVDHVIEVMSSGQVVVRDTVHVSGRISDGFMIGMPSRFSGNILKVMAYDDTSSFQVNTGLSLGSNSYGASVDFNGSTPSVFTVVFVLSSDVLHYIAYYYFFALDYPAYPSLTQSVGDCNVTIIIPSTPESFNITKSDGFVDGNHYEANNLAAYTSISGSALFNVAYGTLYIADIDQLNREITINPSGSLSVSDRYSIGCNSSLTMRSFVIDVPASATNVKITDELGRPLTTEVAGTITYGTADTSRDVTLINATLVNLLTIGESTYLTAIYNMPSATLQGSEYVLKNFRLYPDLFYYVDQAVITITPPEGATITSPRISSLDPTATLTRTSYQDKLTITKDGVSYVDYEVPGSNVVQFSYSYNPVWVSFRPTFWLSLVAVIGCGAIFIYRKRKPGEKDIIPKFEKVTPTKSAAPSQQAIIETRQSQHLTAEQIHEFTDAYEEKKELQNELRSMDARAQKGKIPRRQYKVQRKAIETRIESLEHSITKTKELFRNSGQANANLIRQLDSAEEDLADAEVNIRSLDSRQKTGELSLETYKEEIGDYQKQREKAESTDRKSVV
jgi:hypothetical protein